MFRFRHETLDVYQLALEVSREIRSVSWPRGDGPLGDQARRASASVVLNIAEGHSKGGAARRNAFRIARGEAAEVCAVLDVVDVSGGKALQDKLRRIALMVDRLAAR